MKPEKMVSIVSIDETVRKINNTTAGTMYPLRERGNQLIDDRDSISRFVNYAANQNVRKLEAHYS